MGDEKPPTGDGPDTAQIWSGLHRRLAAAQAATERGHALDIEEKRRILKARAMALAREPEPEGAAGQQLEVVEFTLAHERYAVETACVREVYPCKEITPLPCTPPFVLGITSVRGQILSIIDVKRLFGLPEGGPNGHAKIVILQTVDMELGVLADAILGVRPVPLHEVQPSLPTLTGIRAEYLKGVTGQGLVILDAARILSDRRLIVHEEVEA